MEYAVEAIYEVVIPLVSMTLGGVPVGVGVLLAVQLLNYVGLAQSSNQKRVATVITALLFSGIWASTQAIGASLSYSEWVALIYRAFVGASMAALGYVKFIEPRAAGGDG
jgi:fatty acid desaturase